MTFNAPTRLSQLRNATLAMLDGLTADQLRRQSHPELSPMLWHVGHAFFVESYWLQDRVFGDPRITEAWCELYFPEVCPKHLRTARLPDAAALRAWAQDLSARNDDYWQQAAAHDHPLLENGYLAGFLRQHYAQHLETMRLADAQLRQTDEKAPAALLTETRPPVHDTHVVGAHTARLGTDSIDAYDNERPPSSLWIETFKIARHPVSNAEWLGFMHNGGYDDPAFWDEAGWQWRRHAGITHPQHWRAHDSGWLVYGETADAVAGRPVHGISWYEARAFARHAGARLPREAEWEAAMRAGLVDAWGEVWEWCDNAFHPYPGFTAFPYEGYSKPWFDGAHFVARGASCHTEIEIRRPGFRNFYPPSHRHVFAGLRLAK